MLIEAVEYPGVETEQALLYQAAREMKESLFAAREPLNSRNQMIPKAETGYQEVAMDTLSWDKGQTADMIMSALGKRQWVNIQPALHSCTGRLDYARIHYHDAKKLFDDFSATWLANRSMMRSWLRGDEEFCDALHEFNLRVQAYVVAFLQSLHSVYESWRT